MSDLPFDSADSAVIRKVMRRLIPFCILCYLLNYIDRTNISLAQLKMLDARTGVPDFTSAVFKTGAAIFFLGYFLFELPSNLIQQRVGPRRWIARIMISWGVVTICFMLTAGPASFYSLRFLLGITEAGFFPGMILYLSCWIPHAYRARATAWFLTATAIAGVIGNPLTGTILYLGEKHPFLFRSWQWVFLLEGFPSILLGIFTLYFLTDHPNQADWLNADERARLAAIMARDHDRHPTPHLSGLRHALASPHTWFLSLLYGLTIFGFYSVTFFTPEIIKDALLSAGTITPETPEYMRYLVIGLFSAIPFSAAAIGMVLIGRSSDRRNERKFHLAFACGLIAAGLSLAGLASMVATGNMATVLTMAGLSIGAVGTFGMFGPFWALPPQFLVGNAASAAFAIINSIGNLLGGFLGPKCFDYLDALDKQRGTHSAMQYGFLMAGGLGALAGIMAALLRLPRVPGGMFPVEIRKPEKA